jgi:hypothetical protein
MPPKGFEVVAANKTEKRQEGREKEREKKEEREEEKEERECGEGINVFIFSSPNDTPTLENSQTKPNQTNLLAVAFG